MEDRVRRLFWALAGLAVITLVGTFGFYAIGRGQWSLLDCAYMTAITVTTVGYGEVVPVSTVTSAKIFTIALMFVGVAAVLYCATSVMAFVVEGDLQRLLGSKRMEKQTRKTSRHYIVCGVGRTGRQTVANLHGSGETVVLVDQDEASIRAVHDTLGVEIPFVVGDATEEAVLEQAGIGRARGIICALDSDQANLYAVVTARELNPKLRIVAKADNPSSQKKFKLVGANSVVAPTEIGGRRLFLEAVQPAAAAFLEKLLLPGQMDLTVSEIRVDASSRIAGLSLAEANFRKEVGNVLILAIQPADRTDYEYNIQPTSRLVAGSSLMAMASPRELALLRLLAAGDASSEKSGGFPKPPRTA